MMKMPIRREQTIHEEFDIWGCQTFRFLKFVARNLQLRTEPLNRLFEKELYLEPSSPVHHLGISNDILDWRNTSFGHIKAFPKTIFNYDYTL